MCCGTVSSTFRAVGSGPTAFADARRGLQVKVAVAGTVREALPRLLVHVVAVVALPTLPADAAALDAEPVAGALWVLAIDCGEDNNKCGALGRLCPENSSGNLSLSQSLTLLAVVPGVASGATAPAVDAFAVAVAVGDLAFVVLQLALGALPTREAPALTLLIVPVPGTKQWAHTCKDHGV